MDFIKKPLWKYIIGFVAVMAAAFGLVAAGIGQGLFGSNHNVVNSNNLNQGLVLTSLIFAIFCIIGGIWTLALKVETNKVWLYWTVMALTITFAIITIVTSSILFDDMVIGALPGTVPAQFS